MDQLERSLSRRRLLQRGAAGAVGLYAAGAFGLAGRAAADTAVTLNWLTWSDHYFPEQLQEVEKTTGIGARPQLFSDDADAYIKVKAGGGGWDMSSEDALWVPKFYNEGLIEAFDIKSFPVAKQLYSAALDVPFWKAGSNQMGYPFGWSSVQIYYNPKYVKTKPDSWHALLDKQYAKRIVLENQPTDLMAMAGIATGAKKPYDMTTDEISQAKDFLVQLKPNVLKLVSQNPEAIRALTDELAWLTCENIGTDARVKDAGGPQIDIATPKEGLFGWMDAEMLLKEFRAPGLLREVHRHDGAGGVDRQELHDLRPPAVQRGGVQAAGQAGQPGARRPLLLQRAGAAARHGAEGAVLERAGVHRRVQRGARRISWREHR